MVKVAFVTLGCPKNEVDSAAMRALVEGSRYELCDEPRDATVVVVNTCSFIATATEASIETILDLADPGPEDSDASARRPFILVTGCMVNRYGAGELEGELPEVGAFVPLEGEADLLAAIEDLTGQPAGVADTRRADDSAVAPSAWLMIADGCDRSCSYCTIPSIRGPYRSKTPEALVAEARDLLRRGARELVLIAQDTTAYGHDLDDRPTLAGLVTRLCEETDVSWLRLMYLQPEGVTDELIEVIARYPQVVRSLEMPLQHSSAPLLRAMRRSGGRQSFAALIASLRERLPGLALRTTLITGFPGETDADFRDMVDFVTQTRFDYVGVFPFSPEDGTVAAGLPDQVDEALRLKRAQELRDCADEIGWQRAAQHIGDVIEALVEDYDDEEGLWLGRAPFQAPDIDGLVRISVPEDVESDDGASQKGPALRVGAMIKVLVLDSLLYDLEGVTYDGATEN